MAAGTRSSARRRVTTPTILQMEATECGAASLAMVLGHFGRFLTLEELRLRCGVSRDGSSAANLLRAARQLGLTVTALRLEPEQLSELPLPAILHWRMDHFVVLEGLDGQGGAQINDPAQGRRHVDAAELDRSFTGIAMGMAPAPGFERGGAPSGGWGGLRRRLRGHGPALGFLLMLSLPLILAGLLVPAAAQLFADQVLIGGYDHWLRALLVGMVLVALVTGLATLAQRLVMLQLETSLATTGAFRFMRHVLRLPVVYFAQRRPADLPSRVALNNSLAQLLAADLGVTGLNLLASLAFLGAMAAYAPSMAAIVLGCALLNLLALALLNRSLRESSAKALMAGTRAEGMGREGLQIVEVYKAAGAEGHFVDRLVRMESRRHNLDQDMALRQVMLTALPPLLGTLASAAILVVGGFRIMDGLMTVGALIGFQALMGAFNAPVAKLTLIGSKLQTARATLTMLDDTLQHPVAPEFEQGELRPGAPRQLSGAVTLQDVSFGYSPVAPPLLDGISLSLAPGARLAVVGASGSGKSTLGMLLSGLYQPWSGTVALDGHPLPTIPRALLRRSVAVVNQQVVLFEGTVRDNITLWDPTLTDEIVVDCARDAAIHETIARRADGYAGPVAEDGRNFSGGERARIEIARALTQSPAILVLDEATAALDVATEAAVLRRLRRRGCTMIVIAHRLSAVMECDHVVMLDKGRIVASGRPAALLASGGAFARLMGGSL